MRCGPGAAGARPGALGAEVEAAHGARRLRRSRRHPHRRRAARRRRRRRRQHPRQRRQHRRAHGADRAGRRACASATTPTPRCAACSRSRRRRRSPSRASAEPVQSYLVKRAKPRSFRIRTRGIEGVATRMVGRDAELEALQHAFRRLCTERTPRRPSPSSPRPASARAGCSTSSRPGPRPGPRRYWLFRGRAHPQTQGQPFGLLRDILAWRLQIADDDSVEEARRKMEEGIVPLFLHDDGARPRRGPRPSARPPDRHRVARQPARPRHPRRPAGRSATAPSTPRRRCFAACRAGDGPPIVLRARGPALGRQREPRLPRLPRPRSTATCRCCSSRFTRPTLFERRGEWQAIGPRHQRIDLHPLDRTGSRLLANELLKTPAGGAGGAARAGHRRRRRQSLLHGRAGQDADRPGRDRHRRRTGRALDALGRQAAGDAGAGDADRRAAGPARRPAGAENGRRCSRRA